MAEGGYIVDHMANMQYTDGVEITGTTAEVLENTWINLLQDNSIFLEAAVLSGQKLVRIDILVRDGMKN